MKSIGISSNLKPSSETTKLNHDSQKTEFSGKIEADESVLRKFDQIDLSVLTKNAIRLDTEDLYWNPPKELNPNIVDNSAQMFKPITSSVGPSVPQLIFNSDGTSYVDYKEFGTEEAYNQYCEDTVFSGSNSQFFHESDGFLLSAAKQYATISDTQEFLYRPTEDSSYVKTAVDWFCGDKATDEDYQAMSDSIDKIVRELAAKIKNGESTDLSTLKNKLSIGGNEVSVTQLADIQKTYHKLEKGVSDYNFGTATIVEFAMKGVRNAVAGVYSTSLLGSSDTDCSAGFKRLMDKSCESNLEVYNNSSSKDNPYVKSSAELAPKVYELFSNLDTSSKANATADFNNKMSAFDSILKNQFHGEIVAPSYEADVRNLFNNLINQI